MRCTAADQRGGEPFVGRERRSALAGSGRLACQVECLRCSGDDFLGAPHPIGEPSALRVGTGATGIPFHGGCDEQRGSLEVSGLNESRCLE